MRRDEDSSQFNTSHQTALQSIQQAIDAGLEIQLAGLATQSTKGVDDLQIAFHALQVSNKAELDGLQGCIGSASASNDSKLDALSGKSDELLHEMAKLRRDVDRRLLVPASQNYASSTQVRRAREEWRVAQGQELEDLKTHLSAL